jgi:hypothetical protein
MATQTFRSPEDAEHALNYIAALLGAFESWPGADMLEAIYETVQGALHADTPAMSNLEHWRNVADTLGINHDGGDEE